MSTPPSAARVVLGSRVAATMVGVLGVLGAVGVVGIVACSGSVVSLSGDQPVLDGGFTAVDPETISESTRRCSVGTDHPFVCCRFEDDGGATLTCGAWNLTPFYPCPAGYAKYVNPSSCCTPGGSCTPGADDSETDATTLSVIDAGADAGT